MMKVEDSVAVHSEKIMQADIKEELRARRKVYARDYLLSFANLSLCQSKPVDFDPAIWRELQTADISNEAVMMSGNVPRGPARKDRESETGMKPFRDIPEWRRTSIHPGSLPVQQSLRRKSYDDEPAENHFSNSYSSKQALHRGETTQSRNIHGRQALQASGSITDHGKWGHRGDRERERNRFHRNRDSDESDSGHSNVGSPSVRPGWAMPEHDGLLGSGESVRGSFGGVGGHSVKVSAKFLPSGRGSPASTSNESFYSPKVSCAPRREGTDAINNETFGTEEQSTEERLEQERRRRESFELMRRECKRPQEKHNPEVTVAVEQRVAKVEQSVDRIHTSTMDDNLQAEHRSASSESRNKNSSRVNLDLPLAINSPKAPALMSVPSVPRPLVPPGFSQETSLKMTEHKSSIIEDPIDKMEESKKEGGNAEKGEADNMIAESEEPSQSPSDIKTSAEKKLIKKKANLIEEPRSLNESILDKGTPELNGVSQIPGSFYMIEGATAGDSIPKMSKFAKWFPSEGAEEKSSYDGSGGDGLSNILSFFPKSMNSDDLLKAASCKSLENVDYHDTDTRSSLSLNLPLGNPALVLPMPVGPSLEDIEKDLNLATDGKHDNLFPLSYRNSNDGFFGHTNSQRRADASHVSLSHLPSPLTKVPQVFLTCEDIEQSLLAETTGHDEQLSSLEGRIQNTSNPPACKEDEAPNHLASQYLLSLLHKGTTFNDTRDKVCQDHHGSKEGTQRGFSVSQPFLKQEACSQNKDESPVPMLEALFGKAFMKELRSVEAPVSVQSSFDNEAKDSHVIPTLADVNSTFMSQKEPSVYCNPLSNIKLQTAPLTSTQKYNLRKVEDGFHSMRPIQRHEMHDGKERYHTGYLSASEWPPVEDSSLDMLARRPLRHNSTGSPFPLSRDSSEEKLEISKHERMMESGGAIKTTNVGMAHFDESSRLGAVLGNAVSNTSASQHLLEELLGVKNVKGKEQAGLVLSEQLCRGVNSSSVTPIISNNSRYGGRSIEFPSSDNVYVESVLDGLPKGGQVYGRTGKMALQETFGHVDSVSITRIDGHLDANNHGVSHRTTDDVQQRDEGHTMFNTYSIDRAESLSRDANLDVENQFVVDKVNAISSNPYSTRVSSSKQQSQMHSSLPIKGLYRSHSPVSTFSAGLNIPLDHLQHALVLNDAHTAAHSSQKQMRPQFLHPPLEHPPMHRTDNGDKMEFSYSGLSHQQDSAFTRSIPNASVPDLPSSQHILPENFLNPYESFPRALLGSNFPGGQFPQHGFGPSMTMHSFMHEQPPYDSPNFLAKGTHGYFPLNGPLNRPALNPNLSFSNVDFQHGLHGEPPLHGQGQPNVNWRPRDLNRRIPRMSSHWNQL